MKTCEEAFATHGEGKENDKDNTYAHVLRKLHKKVNPEVRQSKVLGVRHSKRGDLIKIRGKINKKTFTARVNKRLETWERCSQ